VTQWVKTSVHGEHHEIKLFGIASVLKKSERVAVLPQRELDESLSQGCDFWSKLVQPLKNSSCRTDFATARVCMAQCAERGRIRSVGNGDRRLERTRSVRRTTLPFECEPENQMSPQ